jgi:hypothetical protein
VAQRAPGVIPAIPVFAERDYILNRRPLAADTNVSITQQRVNCSIGTWRSRNNISDFDLEFDNEWESPNDPRIQDWLRAVHLRRELFDALLEQICWWRSPRWHSNVE